MIIGNYDNPQILYSSHQRALYLARALQQLSADLLAYVKGKDKTDKPPFPLLYFGFQICFLEYNPSEQLMPRIGHLVLE